MPETAERLARLEVTLQSIDDRTKAENADRRKRDHELANYQMGLDRTLSDLRLLVQPILDLPVRVKVLEGDSVSKDSLSSKLKSFGFDPDKPTETAAIVIFVKELKDTFTSTRKHAILVTVAMLVGGTGTAVWAFVRGAH